MKYINFVATVITIAIVICTVIKAREMLGECSQQTENVCLGKKKYNVLIAVLFLVGIFVRIYRFGTNPLGFSQDEAMAAYDAKSLMLYGTDHYGNYLPVHMVAWGDSQQSALLDYLMIPFIRMFGMNNISVRIPLLLISLAGMFFLFMLVRDIWGDIPGICALAVCSVNPWHLVQSRYALDCNVFPHFLVLGIFLINRGLQKRKRGILYFGIGIIALSHYGYAVSAYMIPVFLIIYAVYLLKNRLLKVSQFLISIGIYLIIAGPFFVTMGLNAMGLTESIRTPLFTIPAFPHTERKTDILFWSTDIPAQLVHNLKSICSIIFLQHEYVPWDSVEHYGSVFYCMVPVAVLGFLYFIYTLYTEKNIQKKSAYMIILSWLLMAIWGGLITNVDGILRRFNVFYYLEIIFVVLGIYYIYLHSKKMFKNVMLIIGMMTILLFYSYNTSYVEEFKLPSASSYYILQATRQMRTISCDTYYITPSTLYPDAKKVSEIWTLYGFDLDSHYYRGISNDSYGRKYAHEYQKQFQYIEANKLGVIDPEENAVYFINSYDQTLFNQDDFNCYSYGSFCLEVPKWMNK